MWQIGVGAGLFLSILGDLDIWLEFDTEDQALFSVSPLRVWGDYEEDDFPPLSLSSISITAYFISDPFTEFTDIKNILMEEAEQAVAELCQDQHQVAAH